MGKSKGRPAITKVFPVCIDCYWDLLIGREELDVEFCDRRTIRGIDIYVVPELVTGIKRMHVMARAAAESITTGVAGKESLFSSLARRNELLVFPFMFWELPPLQAQERIYLMVEDARPSHLRFLEDIWLKTADVFGIQDTKKRSLDGAFRVLFRTIRSFAGEQEQELEVMRKYTVSLIGKLLNSETVDSKTIKTLAVSRMPRFVNDPKWRESASTNARELGALVDFFETYNGRR